MKRILKMTEKYGTRANYGGIILVNLITGREVFLQPGDDTNYFHSEIDAVDFALEKAKSILDIDVDHNQYCMLINSIFDSYFDCIEENI